MAEEITVSLVGLPETKRLLEQFEGRQLNNRTRRALRAAGKVFRTGLRAEARSRPDLPKSFAKTRTRAHRNPVAVSVSPSSSLSNIFEGGAKPHTIPGSGSSGMFRGWPTVQHPGFAARPFIGPVFDASKDDAEKEFGRVVFEGIER